MTISRTIYKFVGTYPEFCALLDTYRDADGVARKLLMYECKVSGIPSGINTPEQLSGLLNIFDCRLNKCEFHL